MAGLVTRSRPVRGDGSYFLPRGFKLFPKVSQVNKNEPVFLIKQMDLFPKISVVEMPLTVNVMKGTFDLFPKVSPSQDIQLLNIVEDTLQAKNAFGTAQEPPAYDYLTNITKVGGWPIYMYGTSFMSILNSTDSSWFQTTHGNTIVIDFHFSKPVSIRGFDLFWNKTEPANRGKLSASVGIYALDSSLNETHLDTVAFGSDESVYWNAPVRLAVSPSVEIKSNRIRCKFYNKSGTGYSGYNGIQYFKLV